MEIKTLPKLLKNIKEARRIITSELYTEAQITEICGQLGFSDTAFRDKHSKEKLKDFLLDLKYWIKKAVVISNPTSEIAKLIDGGNDDKPKP